MNIRKRIFRIVADTENNALLLNFDILSDFYQMTSTQFLHSKILNFCVQKTSFCVMSIRTKTFSDSKKADSAVVLSYCTKILF